MKSKKTFLRKKAYFLAAFGLTLIPLAAFYPYSDTYGQFTPQVNQNVRIVAFGDSLVAGVGATSGNDFVNVLSERIGLSITNAGTSGLTIQQALSRVNQEVIARDPDIVIVLLGGNDIIQNLPRDQMIANLRTIIQQIQNSGARVILVGVHGPSFEPNQELAFANLAAETGSNYVPNVMSGILGNSQYLSDIVHPNDQGYQIMADRIFPALQSAINSLPNQNLTVTCRPSRTTALTNQTVTWTAFATGGASNYRFEWNGSDSLQGSTSRATTRYTTPGQKSASVRVMSGNASITQNCNETVTITEPVLTGTCRVSANKTSTGYRLQFSSSIRGGATTTTVTWSGSDGLTGTTQSISRDYTTPGQKTATVTARSGNQTLSLTCGAAIDTSSTATTTRNWSGSCTPSISGLSVSWRTSGSNNGQYTYSWSGSDGFIGTSTTARMTYTTEGIKTAIVQIQGNGENHSLTCQAAIASTTNNSSGGNGSGCFIATAAFGTDLDPHVVTLRNFRDRALLTNPIGTEFVQTYYKYSPPIADYIASQDKLRLIVRIALWPIVSTAEYFGYGV